MHWVEKTSKGVTIFVCILFIIKGITLLFADNASGEIMWGGSILIIVGWGFCFGGFANWGDY